MTKGVLANFIDSIIGTTEPATEVSRPYQLIPLSRIGFNPQQPRRQFDEERLFALSQSISRHGVLMPIIVEPIGDAFTIVAGERRVRAAQMAGLQEVPALIKNEGQAHSYEISLVENVQRQDLNSIEEACAYKNLIDRFGYTQDVIAEAIGKSRSHVANTVRLLSLPESVQEMVRNGLLTQGHTKVLVGRADAEELAQRAVDQEMTVREVEELVRVQDLPNDTAPSAKTQERPIQSHDIKALAKLLSDGLKIKAKIKEKTDSSGSLVLEYRSLEQLDTLVQLLSRNRCD